MRIRKARLTDVYGIAKVQVDTWDTTYKGIVPDNFLQNMSVEEQKNRFRQGFKNTNVNVHRFIAENDEGEIIGFIIGGESRYKEDFPEYDGELYAIYLLHAYQKNHIGQELVKKLVQELVQDGYQKMIVWVLAENPAKHFYEKLGATYLDHKTLEIAGREIEESIYAWESIY